MVQIKTFRNDDLKRLEDEVNLWLQSQEAKISVISVNSGNMDLFENMNTGKYYTTTVSYEVKKESKILHG